MSHLFQTTGWQRGPNVTAAESITAVSATPPTGMVVCEGFRGCRIQMISNLSASDVEVTIYTVERDYKRGPGMYITQAMLANDDVLAGTVTGVEGGVVTADEVFGDVYPAITVTPYGTALLNYVNGTAAVVSAALGGYFISDMGNVHGILATVDVVNTLTGYVAFLYKLDN